MVSAWRR
ncbi:UNVERIFIED_CONTAM: hypothetical protein GTU68_000396 [Idotea baltica]|nr:hypothetical protein [Idotea baltica]